MTGRPKKTVANTLPEDWDKDVYSLYLDGASDTEIKSLFKLSNDLFDRWIEDEPEFSEAIKRGRVDSQCWWEQKGRKNLDNLKFNSTLWYMNMKNRFKWKDKHEESTAAEVKGFFIIEGQKFGF